MVGVIEMINKLDENGDLMTFSSEDESVLSNFTDVVSGALSNSLVYKDLESHTNMVESTLEGIGSYIITLDVNGRLKSCNHDLTDLFGSDDDAMRSSSFTHWIKDEKNCLLRENIQSVFNTQEAVNVKNASIYMKNERTLTVNYSIMPLKAEASKSSDRRDRRRSSLLNDSRRRLESGGSDVDSNSGMNTLDDSVPPSPKAKPMSSLQPMSLDDSPKMRKSSGLEKELTKGE